MLRIYAVLLGLFVAAIAMSQALAQDNEAFDIGDEVIVLGDAEVLLIYSEPDTTSPIVEATLSGIALTITDGPEETDEGIWWQVRSPSNIEGWVQYIVNGEPTIGFPGRGDDPTSTSELAIGDDALILTDTFVLMYDAPALDGQQLEALTTGVTVTITDGPEIVDGQNWWQVETLAGTQGWVLEIIEGERILFSEDELVSLTPTVTPTQLPTATPVPTIRLNGTINTTRLNVRVGPGPEYDQVTQLDNGSAITVIGRNNDGTWIQLDAIDQRWINTRYAVIDGDVMELSVTFVEIGDWDVAGTPTGVQAVAETVLRIRGGPGNEYRQLSNPDVLDEGATVDIVGISSDGLFYKVNIGDRSGWINAQYVRLTGNTGATIPTLDPSPPASSDSTPIPTEQSVVAAEPTTSANQCPGSLPQRLQIGGQAEQALDTDPVRVQNEPGGGTTNFFLYPGDVVDIIDGPRCQNIGSSPASWWQIRGVNDWTGWVAEGNGGVYYLQPYDP